MFVSVWQRLRSRCGHRKLPPPPRRLNAWGRHAPRPDRPPRHWWHDAAV